MANRRGKHEGSIYQRADGRWVAMVDFGFIGGRRVRKSFYGSTRRAVSSKLNTALGRQERGALVRTNDVLTVETYLDRWPTNTLIRF